MDPKWSPILELALVLSFDTMRTVRVNNQITEVKAT